MSRAAHAPLRPQVVHQLFFQYSPRLDEEACLRCTDRNLVITHTMLPWKTSQKRGRARSGIRRGRGAAKKRRSWSDDSYSGGLHAAIAASRPVVLGPWN